jgi:large subunit ribosomal protein L28
MSRRCPLSGKAVQAGNLVSHSNHKTRCRFKPNLQKVTLRSELLQENFQIRIATNTIRTIDKNGGVDGFMMTTPSANLPGFMQKMKKRLKLRLLEGATAH